MGSLIILYDNFSDHGLLTGGSWLAALPLTNLQDDDIQRVARSNGATSAATKFIVDLGLPQTVDGIVLGPTNVTPGSTWRVRAYSDNTLTTLVYDSTLQTVDGDVINWANPPEWLEWEDPNFWYGIVGDIDELPQYLTHIIPEATAPIAQYWLIEFFDEGNIDGAVDVGRLMIASAFRPSLNYTDNNGFGLRPLTDVQESLGGLRSYWDRGVRRSFRAQFQYLAEAEVFGAAFRMMLRSGVSRQVFVVPNPDDTNYGTRRSFLATFKTVPEIQQLLAARGALAVDLEEVL